MTTVPLPEQAMQTRLEILDAIAASKASHIGSAFSCVEILTALYFRVLHVDPQLPDLPERDRFVMSKAHAAIALYATLAARGFFPRDWLKGFYADGGRLAGHADAYGVPGVEVSAGSLGHGLALAVGMALAADRRKEGWRTYVLLSDGECDEGSTWEAALLGSHLGLERLTAIIDANGLQGMGRTEDVVKLEPLADKWRSFGWEPIEIDGHHLDQVVTTLAAVPLRRSRPTAVIARTIKGKGVSFMEKSVLWHYRAPAGDELERARAELTR